MINITCRHCHVLQVQTLSSVLLRAPVTANFQKEPIPSLLGGGRVSVCGQLKANYPPAHKAHYPALNARNPALEAHYAALKAHNPALEAHYSTPRPTTPLSLLHGRVVVEEVEAGERLVLVGHPVVDAVVLLVVAPTGGGCSRVLRVHL